MLVFRKMKLKDLEKIYNSNLLRPLVTVPPAGEKFSVIIDDSGAIRGGTSGFRDGDGALIQKVIIEETEESHILKDGLLRSLVHVMEREGVKVILVKDIEELIYKQLGFISVDAKPLPSNITPGEEIMKEIEGCPYMWLDVKAFFQFSHCHK